jgi:hypothetical protein
MSLSPQMDILYLQSVGHVLGIFTRNSEPAQMETDSSAFVGAGLNVRGLIPDGNLVIPPALIGVFRANRVWDQLLNPLSLCVSSPPALPSLMSFPGTKPSVQVAADVIKITLATAAVAQILVLALDTAGGTPAQFSTKCAGSSPIVEVTMTGLVPADTYYAFVFVETHPMALHKFVAT